MTSQVLADYLQRREKLIAEDRALRVDHVRANYTAAELKADDVVRAIRTREADSVWGVEREDVPHPYPGMEFLNGMERYRDWHFLSYLHTAKDIILKTDLFSKIVSKVSIANSRY
jgi:adenosine deaminase CECR1